MSRKGRRAFDGCSVKTIVIEEYFRLPTRGIVPESQLDEDDDECATRNGVGAELDCPRTEEGSGGFVSDRDGRDRLSAVKSLRKLAGTALCQGCEYADMSPQEVADYRTALAESALHLQEVQARLYPPQPE